MEGERRKDGNPKYYTKAQKLCRRQGTDGSEYYSAL